MPVRTHAPRVQVRLVKLVARRDGVAERFAAAARDLDLTPYLGTAGDVTVNTSLLDGNGNFSITVADRSRDGQDTVYALAEPMDLVEIRASRTPTGDGPLPLVMRGFIDSVQRAESVGEDGAVNRAVTIQGHDCAKLLQITAARPQSRQPGSEPILSELMLRSKDGMGARVMPVVSFMETIITRVANPAIQSLFAVEGKTLRPFRLDAGAVDGALIPGMTAPTEESVWTLLNAFVDRPWNELFVEDEESGPVLRFRPTPYKDVDGRFIMPGARDPGVVALSIDDVASWSARRADANVANWYVVPPGQAAALTNNAVNQQTVPGLDDGDHPNARLELYGRKAMKRDTALGPIIALPPTAAPAAERMALADRHIAWRRTRAEQLKAMNRDNSVFESVTATVKGSETLKIGRRLRLTRGGLTMEGYITTVAHTIKPLRAWTTALTLDRCTGFLERSRRADLPYRAEFLGGPYR